MNQVDSSFAGNGNIKIYAKKDIIANPKANVVIVHGICEHLDRYDYLTEKLNNAGYNVYRYDARGHGRSEGEKGDLKDYQDYLLDLDIYIESVKKEYPDLKLILLGHSMGGLVATSYASMFSSKIDYLALSGAANVTPKAAKALKFLPMCLIKKIKYKNNLGDGVCSDKEVVEKYNSDPLVLKEATMGLMKNVFIGGCGLVKDNINQIRPKLREKDRIHLVSCGEFEDLLPKNLIIRTVNSHFKNFLTITEKDLEQNLPTAKCLQEIFRVKGLHEFKKAEFAKLVRENIISSEDISPEIESIINEIKNINKVLDTKFCS
jgi:lysophospholipase